MTPKVSVVMPCYNAAAHLQRSIGSVQAQGMTDWELIAVNDGSTDGSAGVLDALARDDPRIRPLHQANAGAAAARNRGLEAAKGKFTAFLDSDDTWSPDFLREMVAALDRCPDAGIAYCGWQNIGLGGGRDKPYVPPDYEAGDKADAFLRTCPWPIHGALVRAEHIRDAGGFDESLSSCMDYDLWLRLGTVHRLTFVPKVLAFYHHHGHGQITGNKAKVALNHWRAQQKYLVANPAVAGRLGRPLIRKLTAGELLHRGYVAYWRRDLPAARTVFRAVMSQGYGGVKDWLYMLPAWLPELWHRRLLGFRDTMSRHMSGGR
jgi:glycosyltransferase involved in cell wall biosynthesis